MTDNGSFDEATPRRRNRLRTTLFALVPLAAAAGGHAYVTGGRVMSTESAYVRSDIVGISTDVSGIVKEIDVRENQTVETGTVLFRLDDLPFRLALDRANAQLALVRDDIEASRAKLRDLEVQMDKARSDLDFHNTDLDRQRQLVGGAAASRATYDQSRHNVRTDELTLASLREQAAAIAASLDGRPDDAIETHSRYKDAAAARDEIARQLSHAEVRAPAAGVVTKVASLQVGQYLPAATTAFSLVSPDHPWIEASPKETELTNVKPGQPVSISVDTYPDVKWSGVVESISPATDASFSLLPAQNTTGNWVKVVQRVPMRVRIDAAADKPALRAGMSVVVDVDTGKTRGLPAFVTNLLGETAPDHG